MIQFSDVSGSVRVVVYDSKIEAMNFPGGDVYEYTKSKTRTCTYLAKSFAPMRSGRLAAGIRSDVRPRTSSVVGRVRATARHSAWVHEGTKDREPIFSPDGNRMSLPPGGGYSARRLYAVKGQRAQPFLMEALAETMATPYIKFDMI